MPTLIGIGGALAAGKDTVGDHLVAKHGFTKLFMSDPLARALELLNPVLEVDHDGYKTRYSRLLAEVGYTKAKEHPEVRRLLQVLGTEVGRNLIGENTWVDIAGRSIDEQLLGARRSVVITGIRFRNELEMIRRRGGILLYVSRPAAATSSSHASETSLKSSDFDETVLNAGSLKDLYDYVDLKLPSWSSVKAHRTRRKDLELDIWPVYDH